MKKVILHHIASDFGKSSSIGFRSAKICEYIKSDNKITIICRSNKYKRKNSNQVWTIGIVFLFSRFFGLIKAFIKYDFKARKYELILFNLLSIPYIIIHYFLNITNKKYFHSWDSSLWLLTLAKKLDYRIIKDCAMTPSKASLIEAKKNASYYEDNITTKNDIFIEKKIFEKSDLIISPSKYTSNFIVKEYGINIEKIQTIPFGIDKKNFMKINNNKKIDKRNIRLGFVGLVNMRKGIRWLINDLNAIYDGGNKNFELHIFGRIFKEELETLENAKFKIIKYGFIDISQKNIYTYFDILVHPSFIEGSAKCIYEAMAAGLPIICTEQSGSIVKKKKCGFVIKAGDKTELKKAIIYFLRNEDAILSMGESSRSIISNYTWEIYAKNVSLNY